MSNDLARDSKSESSGESTWAGWISQHVSEPAINVLKETYNTAANAIDFVSVGTLPLPKLSVDHGTESPLLSGAWWAENLASGAAMTVPYMGAAKVAQIGLTLVAGRFGVLAKLASAPLLASSMRAADAGLVKIAKNQLATSVLGAGLFDGLRDKRDASETHLSNATGGMTALYVFGTGNAIANLMPVHGVLGTAIKASLRIPIGAAGGLGSLVTSSAASRYQSDGMNGLVSATVNGDLVTTDHVYKTLVSSAALNFVQPAAMHGLSRSVDYGNIALGRGLRMDRYMQHAQQQGISPDLDALAAANPTARVVVVNGGPNFIDHENNRIYLAATERDFFGLKTIGSPAKLGHELRHGQYQSELPTNLPVFQQAVFSEVAARTTERSILSALGRKDLAQRVSRCPSVFLDEQIGRGGLTYREYFTLESIPEESTSWRPKLEYSADENIQSKRWARHVKQTSHRLWEARYRERTQGIPWDDVLMTWPDLDPSGRDWALELAREHAPQEVQYQLWKTAITDETIAWENLEDRYVSTGLHNLSWDKDNSAVFWHRLASEASPAQTERLARSIAVFMPYDFRAAALVKLLTMSPSGKDLDCVDLYRIGEKPKALKTAMRELEGNVRQDFIRRLLSSGSTGWNNAPTTKALYKVAEKSARPEDIPTIQRHFFAFGDNGNEIPSKTRKHMVKSLSPTFLSRLLVDPGHIQESERLAQEHPDFVRRVAGFEANAKLGSDVLYKAPVVEARNIGESLHTWYQSGLADSIRVAIGNVSTSVLEFEEHAYFPASERLAAFLGELSSLSKPADVRGAMQVLADTVLSDATGYKGTPASPEQLTARTTFLLAAAHYIGEQHPEILRKEFVAPITNALADAGRPYAWKLAVSRVISESRRVSAAGGEVLELPDLRMPPINLPEQTQRAERQVIENELSTGFIPSLAGSNGILGKRFPEIYGDSEHGGMVGITPPGHDFPIEGHSQRIIEAIRKDQRYIKLPENQKLLALWLALHHDALKRPQAGGQPDTDHDFLAAVTADGIGRTYGYSDNWIKRWVDLLTVHRALSFEPSGQSTSDRLQDPAVMNALSMRLLNPHALTLVDMFNRYDIQNVHTNGRLYRPEVHSELDKIHSTLKPVLDQLSKQQLPPLLSEPTPGFRFNERRGDFALAGHHTANVENFIGHKKFVESPDTSLSASILLSQTTKTGTVRSLQHIGKSPFVVLLNGPPEHISQAHRQNLGTGYSVDGRGHEKLVQDWSISDKAEKFSDHINGMLADDGYTGATTASEKSSLMQQLRMESAGFNSLDEVQALAPDHPVAIGQRTLQRALITKEDGTPIDPGSWNEIKLWQPTVGGVAVIRQGRSLYFQGMARAGQSVINRFFGGNVPNYVVFKSAPQNAIKVPESLWRALDAHNLPLEVLDPD